MSPFSRHSPSVVRPLVAVLMVVCSTIHAQDLTEKLPADSNIIKGTLPNGLTYYICPNGYPKHRVELRLVVKAGSILEDDDQQGLAHFMEHMNFNGTANFRKNELVSYLQTIGMENGADINAYTGFDNTVYKLSLPVDAPGNLEKGFQVLEDWAHNALLTDADIDAERGVVLEESRLHKGAQQRTMELYISDMLSGSRYAQRIPIGKDSIIRSFRYETLRRFYNDWYRPDLMAVVVAGDINSSTALNLIKKHFSLLANPPNERPHFYADIQHRSEPGAIVVKDKEATYGILMILYPFSKKQEIGTLGDYRDAVKRSLVLSMISERITDMTHSGRLSRSDREFASFNTILHGYEAFEVHCSFSNEWGPGGGIRFLTRELARIRDHGFSQSEYDFSRKEVMSGVQKEHEQREYKANSAYAGDCIENFTQNSNISGPANEYNWHRQLLPAIELKDLNAMAKAWIQSPGFFVVAIAPDKPATWPDASAVLLKMTQDGFYQFTEPLKEKEVDTVLMENKPRAGKVTGKIYDTDLQAITYTLSNGVKVTIKAADHKKDEVLLRGIKLGGNNNYDSTDKCNYTCMEYVIQAMGFGEFKANEMYKAIADKRVTVATEMKNTTDVVTGASSVKDFELMMQLVHLRLTKPRKDMEVFKAVIKSSKSHLDNLYADPDHYFKDTLSRVMYNNSALAPTYGADDLENMDLKRILKIYKNEFGCADGYHFFIVGNVDTGVVRPLIETYLGSIRERGDVPQIKDNGLRPVAGTHRMTVHKGKEQKSWITGIYHGSVPYSEQLELNAHVLTEILNIKVIEHIREEMAIIYTGGFTASVRKDPYEHYTIELNLPCGPGNVDKLVEAAGKEIKAIKEHGPTVTDLEKVKNHLVERHKTKRDENQYWINSLENTLFWHKSRDRVLQYDSLISKITPADIQATARLLFDGKNEFIAVLMPQ